MSKIKYKKLANEKKNIEKVYIIDSPISALMAAIFCETKTINCIIEIKTGIDDQISFIPTIKAILSSFVMVEKIVTVPNQYFNKSKFGFLSELRKKKKLSKEIKNLIEYNESIIYIGSVTSVILNCIPADQQFYFDHGTGDYLRRLAKKTFKQKVKIILINILRINLIFSKKNYINKSKGATLAKFRNDKYLHLDYQSYQMTEELSNIMHKLLEATENHENKTLVLPTSTWHSIKGFDGDATNFNKLNIQLIERNCTKEELLILKYHPTLYNANNTQKNLTLLLSNMGYSVLDVDDIISDQYKGQIPGELIVKFCKINKVVCEQSSLLYNLSHNEKIKLVADPEIYEIPLARPGIVKGYIKALNAKLNKPIEKRL